MGKLLLPLLFLTTACAAGATSVTRSTPPSVACTVANISPRRDDAIAPYVEEFSQDATFYNRTCTRVRDIILSDNVKAGIAGYCQPRFAVVLSRTFWATADEWERRTLVYHELGHCALDLDHTEEEALAIMNPYILPGYLASRHWPQLVKALMEKK
jgi:hypothetical protein